MAEGTRSKKRRLEEQASCPDWAKLPELILEQIYSLVTREDQLNMPVVCKDWRERLRWKNFRLVSPPDTYPWPEMDCVRNHSNRFKHVQFKCSRGALKNLPMWFEQFEEFLHILAKRTKLDSIEFLCLRHAITLNDRACSRMCGEIGDFLVTQNKLRRLEFVESDFKYKDAVEVLRKATEKNKASLSRLVLQKFVDELDFYELGLTNEEKSISPIIFSLEKLAFLKIDYVWIFGEWQANLSDVLEKLRNCPREVNLKIFTLTDVIRSRLLKSSEWKEFKVQYPGLQVELYIGNLSVQLESHKFYIKKHMPITHLSYQFPVDTDPLNTPKAFFKHLTSCKVNDLLVFLKLVWLRPIPDLADMLIPFLKACKKLKSLTLFLVLPAYTLGEILEQLLKHPQSLENIHLDISCNGVGIGVNLAAFKHVLKYVNVNLDVHVHG